MDGAEGRREAYRQEVSASVDGGGGEGGEEEEEVAAVQLVPPNKDSHLSKIRHAHFFSEEPPCSGSRKHM